MSVTIVQTKDQAGFTGKTILELSAPLTVADALRQIESPNNQVDIYINHPSDKITESDVDRLLNDGDVLYVVGLVKGFNPLRPLSSAFESLTGIDISQELQNLVGNILGSIFPLPDVPNNADGQRRGSPNNSLNPQGNVARPYEAIPELFGAGKAYPDLAQSPEFYYENNIKKTRELFILGVGEHTIRGTFKGDTPTDQVPGMVIDEYQGGTFPSDLVVQKLADNVDNLELIASDDPTRESVSRGVFVNATGSNTQSFTFSAMASTITTTGVDVVRNADLAAGVTFGIAGSTLNNGTYTVDSLSYDSNTNTLTINVTATLVDETVSCTLQVPPVGTPLVKNYLYWFDGAAVVNLNLTVGDSFTVSDTGSNNQTLTIDAIDSITDLQYGGGFRFEVAETLADEDDEEAKINVFDFDVPWVGWFQNSGDAETIRTYLRMPRGIRDSEGNAISVEVEIQHDETDASGVSLGNPVVSLTYTFEGNSQDAQFVSVDQAVTRGFYRTRVRRVTDAFENAADLVQWENNAALFAYSGANFGDVTLFDVVTTASGQSSSRNTRFNVDYTRKLPNWTPSGGYDATLTDATSGFRAALYQHVVAAGYPLSQIDIQGLYDIYNGLSDSQLSLFNYSFDDIDISHEQRMTTILDTSRIITYRDGQIWRFLRNEPKPRTAKFDRRTISAPLALSYDVKPDGKFDSLELFYRDSVTNKRLSIRRRIDTGTESIIDDELGQNVREINLVGCNNELQARDRANLEIRRILYEYKSASQTAITNAYLSDIGDRVHCADIYDSETFDGEIRAINGNEYTTSEKLDFIDDGSFYGFITSDNGTPSTPALITKTGDFTFTATFDQAVYIADGSNSQLGSRYSIGSNADLNYYDFIIVGKTGGDNAQLTLATYNELIYEMDGI